MADDMYEIVKEEVEIVKSDEGGGVQFWTSLEIEKQIET